jgi:hypothetical protein
MRTTFCAGLLLVALTACGGGSSAKDSPSPESSSPGEPSTQSPTTYDDPVQLLVDPCLLVTQPEAEEVIGLPVSVGRSSSICTYTATGDGGHIAIEDLAPTFCTLLMAALRQDRFSAPQVRVDDVGGGGMLVEGIGNVQFVAHGGCISVDASHGDTHPSDDIMLDLAKTAAGRVTG